MPSELTVPGAIVKWVVTPALLASAGFFLIGPRLGSVVLPASLNSAQGAVADTGRTSIGADGKPATELSRKQSAKPRKKHKRKKHLAPAPEGSLTPSNDPNFPQAPPPDAQGSASEDDAATTV